MQNDIHQRLGSVTSEAYLQGQSQTDTLSGERDLLQEDMPKAAGGQGLQLCPPAASDVFHSTNGCRSASCTWPWFLLCRQGGMVE